MTDLPVPVIPAETLGVDWPSPLLIRCAMCSPGERPSLLAVAPLNLDRVTVRLLVPAQASDGPLGGLGGMVAGPVTWGRVAMVEGGRWRLVCPGCRRALGPKVTTLDEWARRAFRETRPTIFVRGAGGRLAWAV